MLVRYITRATVAAGAVTCIIVWSQLHWALAITGAVGLGLSAFAALEG